ncbi:hypothetical protein IAU59_000631 [Kwoniella sp. CBS 9459]
MMLSSFCCLVSGASTPDEVLPEVSSTDYVTGSLSESGSDTATQERTSSDAETPNTSPPATSPSHSNAEYRNKPRYYLPPPIDFERPFIADLACPAFRKRRSLYPAFPSDRLQDTEGAPVIVHLEWVPPADLGNKVGEEVCEYQVVETLASSGFSDVFKLKACDPSCSLATIVMKVPKILQTNNDFTSWDREVAIARWLADDGTPKKYKSVFPTFYPLRALNSGLCLAVFMEEMECDLHRYLESSLRADKGSARFGYLDQTVGQGESNDGPDGVRWALRSRLTACLEVVVQVMRMHQCFVDMFGTQVLHPDLKPANILIGEDGQLKIADLGQLITGDELNAGKLPFGTPAYQPAEVLGRPDLFYRGQEWIEGNHKLAWVVERTRQPVFSDFVTWTVGTIL